MKRNSLLNLGAFIVLVSCAALIPADTGSKMDLQTDIPLVAYSQQLMDKDSIFAGRYPEYTIDGVWKYREKVNWLSGFIAGEHWIMYDLTGNEAHKEKALAWTEQLLPHAGIDYTHDMGFIFLPTLMESWERTGDPRYKEAIGTAAEMLARRYNPNGKFIRAWGKLGKQEERAGWMIIDTMMNLELLFKAAEIYQNPEWYRVAYAHALTTLEHSFRQDGSTYHVIEFDPQTGEVTRKRTHQGLGDETTWARGQGWAIHGFAIAYEYTRDQRFREASRKAANYFTKHLPAAKNDDIPSWDLSLYQQRGAQKDASAAAIAAAGLFRLSEHESVSRTHAKYFGVARHLTNQLLRDYTFVSSKRAEQGLLTHTVYHHHKSWGVDESFPPGDYYFLNALQRMLELDINAKLATSDLSGRQRISLNQNWSYYQVTEEDGHPSIVDLPHTWNRFDVMDAVPGYQRGKGIYTKQLEFPEEFSGKAQLHIEAANTYAQVFVNDQLADEHIGGYLGFDVNLTPYLKVGELNTLRIEVDNSVDFEIVPSQKSDFFIYGGLCRDVWLDILPEDHLERLFIHTPEVSNESGKLSVEVDHAIKAGETARLRVSLYDPDGDQIQVKEFDLGTKQGSSYELDDVLKPILWSPETPELYTVNVDYLNQNGKLIDSISDRFGFRWFEFVEHGPFMLNGERVLLRGTHRHEEWAGLGNALPNDLHRRDMEMIKELGANFVRLAHYPQDPEVYKAADELGLLIWDEVPWCRGGAGNEAWSQNTQNMLREMIQQNFNHPSIIIWSLGNEIYWLPDFDGGGDIELLRSELIRLNDIAHEMDPERYTAIRKFYDGDDIVDVFSPSIWAGWYSGVYTNYPKAIKKSQQEYARFFHMEYGGSSHVGRHDENPIDGSGWDRTDGWEESVDQARVKNVARVGDWSENYIVDLFDFHLMTSETARDFTGNAQWAFKDFGTPLRPENSIPYVNQKGLVDRNGKPKDAYYVFKSYWNDSDPFVYIESPSWTDRAGPKGVIRNLSVYSNCSEVALTFNGNNYGRKERKLGQLPAQGLNWDVLFQEGQNEILAIGYQPAGMEVSRDTLYVHYSYTKAGKPKKVDLYSSELPNGNLLITATVVDKDGRRCLDYNEPMYFWSSGQGSLKENLGTPTGSSIIECASGQASIEFRCGPGDKALIEARNQDFKGAYIEVTGLYPISYNYEGQ